MAIQNVQLRLDAGLKNKAERVLEDLGLDMPKALRLFLKKLVKIRAIPFRIFLDDDVDSFTAVQVQEILAALEEARNPKNWTGPFDKAEDMIASLSKRS